MVNNKTSEKNSNMSKLKKNMKIIIWVSIESKPENQSSNQFTELKYFENWASYGQMSFFFSK